MAQFHMDLTDDKGFFCGKILADLGATVIKVETPGGDASRAIAGRRASIRGSMRDIISYVILACPESKRTIKNKSKVIEL